MTDSFCTTCGTAREPDSSFCANCGQRFDGAPAPGASGAPAAGPAHGAPPPLPMGPVYFRPPRNPRQSASTAVAIMVTVSGIFALIYGNLTIQDAWETRWDWTTGQETTVVDLGTFMSGTLFILAFAVALPSAYCALRLVRYQVAVAGPVTLLVGYFATLAYEPFMLVLAVEILILSIVSLGLLYYAIPVYSGRKAPRSPFGPGGALPSAFPHGPTGETTDKYPERPSTRG